MRKTDFFNTIILSMLLVFFSACSSRDMKILEMEKSEFMDKNVDALNIKAIEIAKNSYRVAKEVEAKEFAPNTIAMADKELQNAISTAQSDPSKIDEINKYAMNANKHYKKAFIITKMSKEFEQKGFANEDYILWYWNQLQTINYPTKTKIDFTKDNAVVVNNIKTNISTLAQSLADSQKDYEKLAKEFTDLKEELKAQKENKNKQTPYGFAKEILGEEAEITKKDDGLFLFVTGFHYMDKEAELGSENIELVNKIVKIIKRYPDSSIEITTHTDSRGTRMQNQKLSQARGQNIVKLLAKYGSIDSSRITLRAMGESKPVVSNMLKAGRAKNRRVEIYIHK